VSKVSTQSLAPLTPVDQEPRLVPGLSLRWSPPATASSSSRRHSWRRREDKNTTTGPLFKTYSFTLSRAFVVLSISCQTKLGATSPISPPSPITLSTVLWAYAVSRRPFSHLAGQTYSVLFCESVRVRYLKTINLFFFKTWIASQISIACFFSVVEIAIAWLIVNLLCALAIASCYALTIVLNNVGNFTFHFLSLL